MDELYETAFNLILHAGNSKSKSMLAIKAARKFNFDEVDQLLHDAQDELVEAHHSQTNLIQDEARGNTKPVPLIMVHALDHLNDAMIIIENAREMKNIYSILNQLLKKEKEENNE